MMVKWACGFPAGLSFLLEEHSLQLFAIRHSKELPFEVRKNHFKLLS